MAAGFARPHFTRHLNGAAKPQQFFGQRGFTGIGVGNDGKGAAAGNFSIEEAHGKGWKRGKSELYRFRSRIPGPVQGQRSSGTPEKIASGPVMLSGLGAIYCLGYRRVTDQPLAPREI